MVDASPSCSTTIRSSEGASKWPRLVGAAVLTCSAMIHAVPAWAKVQVVATLPDLAALAQAVGGDLVEVTALAKPNQDPHYVDGRPSFLIPLSRADLLLVNGLELEVGWLPPLLTNARNAKIMPGASGYLDGSLVVQRLEVPNGRIDRAMGDIHPGGNPHYLYDPRAGLMVAQAIADRLSEIDRDHEATYRAQFTAFSKALTAVSQAAARRFAELPEAKRQLVVYHQSLVYLFDWLGLKEIAALEPKPGIAPNPSHVADVLATMRKAGARVIIQEEFYPRRLSDTLAKLTHGEIVNLRGGARFDEGETYVQRIERSSEDLYHALSQ